MAVSIVHVGLPLDHAAIPVGERAKIRRRLRDLKARMRGLGYEYEIVHCSPEGGLEGFKEELRARQCDGVLVGGGVASDPAFGDFLREIVSATYEVRPGAKVMMYDHDEDVRVTVERVFGASV